MHTVHPKKKDDLNMTIRVVMHQLPKGMLMNLGTRRHKDKRRQPKATQRANFRREYQS